MCSDILLKIVYLSSFFFDECRSYRYRLQLNARVAVSIIWEFIHEYFALPQSELYLYCEFLFHNLVVDNYPTIVSLFEGRVVRNTRSLYLWWFLYLCIGTVCFGVYHGVRSSRSLSRSKYSGAFNTNQLLLKLSLWKYLILIYEWWYRLWPF